jgi:uncharacterized protein (DUF2141 family)
MVSFMLCGLFAASVSFADDGGKVIVKVSKLRNDSGIVQVFLFKSGEGFPIPNEQTIYAANNINITPDLNGEAAFENVAYGDYAVMIFHDENSNQQMEFNYQGIPLEGCGASNNGDPRDYESAKFTLNESEKVFEIQMQYFQ